MFEKLSGDYNRGYSRAILDLIQVFDYVNDDLNYHGRRLNYRLAKSLLQCCLENREVLREDGYRTDREAPFIRWNKQKNDFELYYPVLSRDEKK